jgi:Family of unknown function (DUF6459)
MRKRSLARRSPIRLIPYAGRPVLGVAVHGSLALALDSGPPARPVLALVGERPDLRTEARLIARLVLEVLSGVRPYHHLAGRTTPALFERLEPLAARLSDRAAPRLGRVRICTPSAGVAEVAAVASFGPRVQALALRLEYDRRWRLAAVETTVPPA